MKRNTHERPDRAHFTPPERQRGTILLAEGRSGSSWLGQLTSATKQMGVSSEWLDPKLLRANPKHLNAHEYLAAVVAAASTENGCFALKIFPRHLFWFSETYKTDFLTLCMKHHSVAVARLYRQDRLAQAISLVKAKQSGQWSSALVVKKEPVFDRALIAQALHFLERSDAFWNAHAIITSVTPKMFTYETLMGDPSPYVDWVANALGVEYGVQPAAQYAVQRNAQTEEWIMRFQAKTDPTGLEVYDIHCGSKSKLKAIVRTLRTPTLRPVDLYQF